MNRKAFCGVVAGVLAVMGGSPACAQNGVDEADGASAAVGSAGGAGVVEITRAAWVGDVDRESRQPTVRLEQGRARQRLVLWMEVQGSSAAMEKLAADGKLPIRHKWFRETIARVEAEGVTQMTDQIDIPVAERSLLPKLRHELQSRGHFDWRTWSYKDNTRPGTWRVRVVYADNSPVLCGDGGSRRACEYSIEVR
jgi:hypothetical protein